uniref:Uncharacterized protein n=1 Tax=Palpitomonas bilix TaxID=652834 RepID=A0A7S3GKL3_9EUKA
MSFKRSQVKGGRERRYAKALYTLSESAPHTFTFLTSPCYTPYYHHFHNFTFATTIPSLYHHYRTIIIPPLFQCRPIPITTTITITIAITLAIAIHHTYVCM